jgi:hypothetical protein
MEADITFVITSCGRFDLLRQTLDTFFQYNSAPIRRFILVEDSGQIDVFDALKGLPAHFEVLINKSPLGQIPSIDRAYKNIKTEFIFHCEDDWVFTRSGFIEQSVPILRLDQKATVVGLRQPGQNLAWDTTFDGPVFSANGVEYQKRPLWNSLEWGGYTFNPGLRRRLDYLRIRSFSRWGHEANASIFFKLKGMYAVSLREPACYSSGRARRLKKQTPELSAESKCQTKEARKLFKILCPTNPDAKIAFEERRRPPAALSEKIRLLCRNVRTGFRGH